MNQDEVGAYPIYTSLNSDQKQVRLLEISSHLRNGMIDCNLTTRSLVGAKYVVLSYRWGASDATFEISLNGKPFRVRQNLWMFLNVIREQEGMLLWIDALCINQQDTEERNQQVRIMGQIFQSAAMVVSWLGPSNADIEYAFDLMSHVWSSSSADDDADRLPTLLDGQSDGDSWKAIAELCNLQYWGRVWVVQEILLSSNNYLLCGKKTLPWQMFANFISLVDVRFKCPPQYVRAIHNSTAKSYATSKPYAMVREDLQWRIGTQLRHDYGKAWDTEEYNLFRILTMFGDRACTDPLDHIHALLSLTDEGNSFPIQYGIDRLQLFLTVIHFCGQSATQEYQNDPQARFKPVSQRAFMRNVRYLAETMELIPSTYQRTSPYFHGPAVSARGPSPRADPCFPCSGQSMCLQFTIINGGDEPPILRSNTLRRAMSSISFDCLLHLDESSSWFMCRTQADDIEQSLEVVAVVTIKDGAHGRGFKILEPGKLQECRVVSPVGGDMPARWEMDIPAEAQLDLLKVVILAIPA